MGSSILLYASVILLKVASINSEFIACGSYRQSDLDPPAKRETDAEIGRFPFQVLVKPTHMPDQESFHCSGVLIGKRVILTTQSCALPGYCAKESSDKIIVNSIGTPIYNKGLYQTKLNVTRYEADPNECLPDGVIEHDIAIMIILNNQVNFIITERKGAINSICLPKPESEYANNTLGFVLGWELLSMNPSKFEKRLQYVPVKFSAGNCDSASSRHLCVEYVKQKHEKKFCNSRNVVLVREVDGKWELIGFGVPPTAIGTECTPKKWTFLKVSHYVNWIDSLITDDLNSMFD